MVRLQQQNQQDYYTKVLYEISGLVLNIMRPSPSSHKITPAGFASLLLGISVALMLCGSVTFFLGFMLMPWVLGLAIFLYLVGFVSSIGKAIFSHCSSPPLLREEIASWKLL